MAMHGGNSLPLMKSINMKYGSAQGGWCLDVGKVPHGVSLWKRIHHGQTTFARYVRLDVGGGIRVRFWHVYWCEGDAFSRKDTQSLS